MEPGQPPESEPAAPQAPENTGTQPVGSAPPVAGAGAPAPRVRRQSRFRQFVVVALSVIALLCLGGIGTAFILYDKGTQPDLRTPVVVIQQFLTAYLVNRDDAKAAQFECSDASGLEPVRSVRKDDDQRERENNVAITVAVDSVREISRSGKDAQVAVDLVFATTINGTPQRDLEHWEFTTRNDSGWRVCSGHEVT